MWSRGPQRKATTFRKKEQWVGDFHSAMASSPQQQVEVQHVKNRFMGKFEEPLSVAPRDEASRSSAIPLLVNGEQSSVTSNDLGSHSSRGRSSGRRTCFRKCLRFHVTFLVFAALGATVFVLLCQRGYVEPRSQTAGLLDAGLGVQGLGWWGMPARQPWSHLLQGRHGLYKRHTRSLAGMNLSFGVALGRSAPRLMFDTTKVEGVWEDVPEKLRGVFWLRGRDREELMVMQYSRWFENTSLLVVPTAPFSYAWSAGRGADAEQGEGFYYEPEAPELRSFGAIVDSPSLSLQFSECPGSALCSQGKLFAYATVEVHPTGSAEMGTSPRSLYRGLLTSSETWQEEPSDVPGMRWNVVESLGVFKCDCVQRRTFALEKIVDSYGEPMEPQHSDFMRIAGSSPLYFWTGWPGETERRAAEQKFSAQAFASPQ